MPEGDTLARTAAGLRPYLVGREVAAAKARAPGPQVDRLVGSTVTGVEAMGKNLLIRFDNGLEVRTHLRMRGSWHRYRPGEAWRRAPGRAVAGAGGAGLGRRLLRRPGGRAVRAADGGDAPVALEARARPAGRPASTSTRRSAACGHRSAPELTIAEGLLDQRALAGIGNEVKNLVLWEARLSPWTPLRDVDDAALRGLVERSAEVLRIGAATGRRPLGVHGRAGRPCPRCGTIVQAKELGRELPRLTYWCPRCQPDPRSDP